ncbi:hypothetical protein ACJX0J_028224, partial [Zea mays]
YLLMLGLRLYGADVFSEALVLSNERFDAFVRVHVSPYIAVGQNTFNSEPFTRKGMYKEQKKVLFPFCITIGIAIFIEFFQDDKNSYGKFILVLHI